MIKREEYDSNRSQSKKPKKHNFDLCRNCDIGHVAKYHKKCEYCGHVGCGKYKSRDKKYPKTFE